MGGHGWSQREDAERNQSYRRSFKFSTRKERWLWSSSMTFKMFACGGHEEKGQKTAQARGLTATRQVPPHSRRRRARLTRRTVEGQEMRPRTSRFQYVCDIASGSMHYHGGWSLSVCLSGMTGKKFSTNVSTRNGG